MNINSVELMGKVTKLNKRIGETNPACNRQYFMLEFDSALCADSIEVCDWSNADVKDGDTVIVRGKLRSNQRSINDGYTEDKEWFIMVSSAGTNTDGTVIKVAE